MQYITKLVNLGICESRNLRDSQTSKIIIHSEKLVLDPKFSQDSRVKISNDPRESHYEISVCETRESCYEICLRDSQEVSLENFVARLVSRESRYKICVCETHEKRVLLLILTRDSHENLARMLGLKSESRFSPEFHKLILVSTLISTQD